MKLEEVARLAGVSRTTASYVINGKAKQYRVSDKTIAKVMEVVKEHNFQPNAVAAGLRAGKTYSIGIIIPDLENISYTRIANYIEQKVREAGYQLLISCSEDNPEIEKECISHLKHRQVDAIIVSSSFISDYSFYENWDNSNTPIFALDRPLDQTKFKSILCEDKQGSKELVKEFCKMVENQVLYIGAVPELSVSQLREQGFNEGIKNLNKDVNYLYAQDYSRTSANLLLSKWLENNPIPKALFVTSFALLQGVIDALLHKNGFLPKDMVIATFGDNELLDFLPCNIISLSQDHKKIAEITVETLLGNLKDKKTYQSGYIEVKRKLKFRGSLNQQRQHHK